MSWWNSLIHPDDLDRRRAEFERHLESGGTSVSVYRIRRRDGTWIWVKDTARVSAAAAGAKEVGAEGAYSGPSAATGVVGAIVDITARRTAEETLRASEEFSRTVLEKSPDCVKVLDAEGRLEYINANGLDLMEIEAGAAVWRGTFWWEMWDEEGSSRDMVRKAVDDAARGERTRFQAFRPTQKGTPKWWDVIVSPAGSYSADDPAGLVSGGGGGGFGHRRVRCWCVRCDAGWRNWERGWRGGGDRRRRRRRRVGIAFTPTFCSPFVRHANPPRRR